jgi:flagellar basal body-associated protein FliL
MEEQQAPEKGNVSKRTVVVLLVIAILVTALGVWTVLQEAGSGHVKTSTSQGTVSMTILPSENSDAAAGNAAPVA